MNSKWGPERRLKENSYANNQKTGIIHTKDACWKDAEASGVATAGVLFV